MSRASKYRFHGPKVWLLSAALGVLFGAFLSWVAPAAFIQPVLHGHLPIPTWLLAPFALMLACIALMPFVHARLWETYYPDIAFVLGGIVTGYVLLAFGAPGQHAMGHAALEYFQFIALIGSLYVVSGGVVIQIAGRGRPAVNTLFLTAGAVLANVVGTTGASMLLIRPFLRLNKGRLKPFHIALFIMIVSNCGGCLTPIADPPLFLGYLKGVPFFWAFEHLWPAWLFVNGMLLAIFFMLDFREKMPQESTNSPLKNGPAEKAKQFLFGSRNEHEAVYPSIYSAAFVTKCRTKCAGFFRRNIFQRTASANETKVSVRGVSSLLFLALLMLTVIFDSYLKSFAPFSALPAGAILQIVIATLAYRMTPKSILEQNGFHWHPVEEVACLFAGIFATMVPALIYLDSHAASLGLSSPTHFYFAAGSLSSVLDNAPTYVSFLQTAFGIGGIELSPTHMPEFLSGTFAGPGASNVSGAELLRSISMGAVFFGGMTYIGNGPNFMVKAIAEADGTPAPSFFGYMKYALMVLLPVLLAAWALFVR